MHIDETKTFSKNKTIEQASSRPGSKKTTNKIIGTIVITVVVIALVSFLSYWLSPKTMNYVLVNTYEAHDGLLQANASTDMVKVSYEYDAADTSMASADEYRAYVHYSFLFIFQRDEELPTDALISESISKYGENIDTSNVEDNPVKIIVHLPEEARNSIEAIHNAI